MKNMQKCRKESHCGERAALACTRGLLLACLWVPAVPVAAETARPFADGDVVSIIGDSITAGRPWHRYIHEYHVTRFPDRRVTFVNAGISGDTSDGVLRRLSRYRVNP